MSVCPDMESSSQETMSKKGMPVVRATQVYDDVPMAEEYTPTDGGPLPRADRVARLPCCCGKLSYGECWCLVIFFFVLPFFLYAILPNNGTHAPTLAPT